MTYFAQGKARKFSRYLPLAGILLLGACENGINLPTSAPPPAEGTTVETIETDVAAPEAFSITDKALWDGRPTFGGVWIAYPDIEQPERVRITNPDNGKTVIGALYKREREFPGPKIELSADAAAALGVLAGTPTELTIVALRRKTVEIEVEAPADPLAPPDDIEPPLHRPASLAAPAPAPAPQPEPVPEPAPAPVTPPATTTPAVSATPLPATQGAPDTQGFEAYIQVSTTQTKAKAEDIKRALERAGLDVEIRERKAGNKTLYRVIVGPATSPDALKIMMGTVRALGYKDAFKLG